jgi:rhodanese-related sulfurtransferase
MNLQDQKSAKESFDELAMDESKRLLVDVRSNDEWSTSGVADLSLIKNRVILCEWRQYPSMNINENFFSELTKKLDLNKIESLYFICAAGVRSQEAALYTNDKIVELGKKIHCINIADGFEGNTSNFFGFGNASGWKASGLPWCELESSTFKNQVED